MSYDEYKFDVKSGHEKLGQLVANWVQNPKCRPTSIEDLKKLLEAEEVVVEIGSKVNSINWVSMEYGESVTILLPPSNLLTQEPPGYGDYPLPEFYSNLAFDGQPKKITDKKKFRESRVGEYTTQKCW